MPVDFPLVTALCLTRNRREWMPQAIRGFQGQDYPEKEMLILADGEDVSDLVPDDPRIYLHATPNDTRPRTVGEKRNLGCSLVRSDIIVVFDDDDFSAPGRISDQVRRLLESGKAVTGYHSMRFTDGRRWWLYAGRETPNLILGTSLCFYREWWEYHRFQNLQVTQDELFGYAASEEGQSISVDAGDLMVATVHRGNTSRRDTDKNPWWEIHSFSGIPGFSWPDLRIAA